MYFVYILASSRKTLYIGVTNDLERRLYEHKHKLIAGFTARYNISKLVYFEFHQQIDEAIAREKYLKGLLRAKKITLIESSNPLWKDLSTEWIQTSDPSLRSG